VYTCEVYQFAKHYHSTFDFMKYVKPFVHTNV